MTREMSTRTFIARSRSVLLFAALAAAAAGALAATGFSAIGAQALSSTAIRIGWQPLQGAAAYQIIRNGQLIVTLNAAAVPMTYDDTGLAAATTYSYAVAALSPVTMIQGLPNTPNAGKSIPSQSVLQTSATVSVTTMINVTVIGPQITLPTQPLRGFVDLHTHPLANLAFGGKLIYGGVDADPNGHGSLLPADPNCNRNVRALSEAQALGHDLSTHGAPQLFNGGLVGNGCGDEFRAQIIPALQGQLKANNPPNDAFGYPSFINWPTWDDVTHQKMWVEWIRRAYLGGLRVMVALAVNNKTLGDLVRGSNDLPADDASSADLQLDEMRAFVGRHNDFMEVAFSSADVQRIVGSNRLAVVLGVEIDHIGNFGVSPGPTITAPPPPDSAVIAEIDRLFTQKGVRYIFPIHLLDNSFGGTAAYNDSFNTSNVRESGHPYALACATPPQNAGDAILYRYKPPSFNNKDDWLALAGTLGKLNAGIIPPSGPDCCVATATSPCGQRLGQQNSLGLLPSGTVAIKEMMRLGMLIDVDHMSQNSLEATLTLAESFGYPVNSGHNAIRGDGQREPLNPPADPPSERSFTPTQYRRIGALHGMAGVGTAGLHSKEWLDFYRHVMAAMGPGVVGGFGTDTDGLERGMPPPFTKVGENDGTWKDPAEVDGLIPDPAQQQALLTCQNSCGICDVGPTSSGKPSAGLACTNCKNSCAVQYPRKQIMGCVSNCPRIGIRYANGVVLPMSFDGSKGWDYNVDGVAHYGLMPDFVRDIATLPPDGAAMVNNSLMYGADYFYHTWRIAETRAKGVH